MSDIQRRGLLASIGARLPLASFDELRVLDAALEAIEQARDPHATSRRPSLSFALAEIADELALEDQARAELHEAARDEMFAGVDRSATPESLQHVAEPMPVMDAIRQGIETVRALDDDRELGGEG